MLLLLVTVSTVSAAIVDVVPVVDVDQDDVLIAPFFPCHYCWHYFSYGSLFLLS